MSKSILSEKEKAIQIRDKILESWNPPLHHGNETPAQVAQTSSMMVLAYIFGKDFLGDLTEYQNIAIDGGLGFFNKVLHKPDEGKE